MDARIILDLSSQHAVLVQIARARRKLRIDEAALASGADFPDAWSEGDGVACKQSSDALVRPGSSTGTMKDARMRLLNQLRLLAPLAKSHRVACILPDHDYEYRIDPPVDVGQKSSGPAAPEDAARLSHCYWNRPGFPADTKPFRRLATGMQIGVHRDVVKGLRQELQAFDWDLESVFSPIMVVARCEAETTAAPVLAMSLIEGSNSLRLVLHYGGCPVFSRRLRVSWLRAPSQLGAVEGDWRRPLLSQPLSRDRSQELLFEVRRTIQYTARRCPLPIVGISVYGRWEATNAARVPSISSAIARVAGESSN
ncbi:MAG: hypothetical protein R3B96_24070 [Pirellulaceae bacterium]